MILLRELDERLGLGELIQQHLTDPRGEEQAVAVGAPSATVGLHPPDGVRRRQRCQRLSKDPTFRLIGSVKIWKRGAALTSQLLSFETEVPA